MLQLACCSGFEVEPYPVTEMLAHLTGDSATALTPAMAPSHTAQSGSPPVDAVANDVTKQLDQVQVSLIVWKTNQRVLRANSFIM